MQARPSSSAVIPNSFQVYQPLRSSPRPPRFACSPQSGARHRRQYEHPTSNIEHPTSNAERRTSNKRAERLWQGIFKRGTGGAPDTVRLVDTGKARKNARSRLLPSPVLSQQYWAGRPRSLNPPSVLRPPTSCPPSPSPVPSKGARSGN